MRNPRYFLVATDQKQIHIGVYTQPICDTSLATDYLDHRDFRPAKSSQFCTVCFPKGKPPRFPTHDHLLPQATKFLEKSQKSP